MESPPKPKRKYHRRKPYVYTPSPEQTQRLTEIKRLYEELGTLEQVAERLNLTRERVRQLLEKGQKYGLFTYELTRTRLFKHTLERVSSAALIDQIQTQPNRYLRCQALGISMSEYFKLLKHYQIDSRDYQLSSRMKKYIIRYSDIVDTLGHHPSTTEMQSRTEWHAIHAAILRLWGSIENFRNEFGIEKPAYALHPNTIQAFKRAKAKKVDRMLTKIEQVAALIAREGPIGSRQISARLSIPGVSLYGYIHYLLDRGMIEKIGDRKTTTYRSASTWDTIHATIAAARGHLVSPEA